MADGVYRGRFERLDICGGWLLWEEAGVVADELAFFVKVACLFLSLDIAIITHQALFDEKDIFADVPYLQQVLPFFKVAFAKQRSYDNLVIGREWDILTDGFEKAIHLQI